MFYQSQAFPTEKSQILSGFLYFQEKSKVFKKGSGYGYACGS